MIANAPSSLLEESPEVTVDLQATGMLAPLPAAWLAGRDLDLLAPLRLAPGSGLPPLPPRPQVDRRELAAALAVSNRAYGHPDADRLAAKLADPATRVVVTGQQPGLLGGPLLTVAKAMAASRWAAALEEAGEPAVAVFWVATEDHDWAEVSHVAVPTASGVRTFDLGPDPEPLVPVGMRTLGPAVEEVLRQIAEAVPGDRYAEWLRTVAAWYRPEARFGEAFGRILAAMLGGRCPLLLDAMHPALKAAQRPHLTSLRPQTLVLERHQIEKAGEIGLTLGDLLGDRARLDHRLAEREGGDFVGPVRARIEAALTELRTPALAADGGLERPFDKTREQILRALDLFGDKATAAWARRNEVVSRRVDQLRDLCLPQGKLQERSIVSAHYQGKYGERFAESYWEQLSLDPVRLQVIAP